MQVTTSICTMLLLNMESDCFTISKTMAIIIDENNDVFIELKKTENDCPIFASVKICHTTNAVVVIINLTVRNVLRPFGAESQ